MNTGKDSARLVHRRHLEQSYLDLINAGEIVKLQWCTNRTALRAMLIGNSKTKGVFLKYKLVQSNLLAHIAFAIIRDAATVEAANPAAGAAARSAATVAARSAHSAATHSAAAAAAAHSAAAQADATEADAVVAAAVTAAVAAVAAADVAVSSTAVAAAGIISIPVSDVLTEVDVTACVAVADAYYTKLDIDLLDIAAADVDYVRENVPPADNGIPLWVGESGIVGEQIQSLFFAKLESMNLAFLKEDINNAINNSPLKWSYRYALDLSRVIESESELLQRAIVLGEKTEPSQDVRIVLLGSGGAGKTELASRLKNIKPSHSQQTATSGIDIQSERPVNLIELLPRSHSKSLLQKHGELTSYLWDFGGQRLYHGLHSAFLHENCVYVLVVDNRHEQAVDEWLHQVRHYAGRDAAVLVVTNEYENCFAKQNEARLCRQFSELINDKKFHYFSCNSPDKSLFEQFVTELVGCCFDTQKRVFSTTLAVKKVLDEQYNDTPFCSASLIDEVVSTVLSTEERDESIHRQLKQLGWIVPIRAAGDLVCINPEWLIESAYRLINSALLRDNNGVITQHEVVRNIGTLFDGPTDLTVKAEHIERLFQFISEIGQCTKVSDQEYLFPDAASFNEPSYPEFYIYNENSVEILFDLPYFPIGLHAKLVSGLNNTHNLAIISKLTWREGFVLHHREGENALAPIATVQYVIRTGSVHVESLSVEHQWFSHALMSIKSNLENILSKLHLEIPVKTYRLDKHGVISGIDLKSLPEQLKKGSNNFFFNTVKGDQVGTKIKNSMNKSPGASQVAGQGNTVNQNTQLTSFDSNSAEALSTIVTQLLTDKVSLEANDLLVVAQVNKALNDDDQSILATVWEKVQNAAGALADSATVIQFALDNKGATIAAMSSAIGIAHTLPPA